MDLRVIEADLSSDSLKRKLLQLGEEIFLLETLDISGTKLSDIGDALEECCSLEELNVSKNPLLSFDPIWNVCTLSVLDLRETNMKEIPDSISRLESLSILNISDNPIKMLGNEIAEVPSLDWLYCSDCQVNFVTPKITKLVNLDVINLYGNKIEEQSLMKVTEGVDETQERLKGLSKYFTEMEKCFDRARTTTLFLIHSRKQKRFLPGIPIAIVKQISWYVYSTRREKVWE